MPPYVLEDIRTGQLHERFLPFAAFDKCTVNGNLKLLDCRLYRVHVAAQHRDYHDTTGNWPMESWALGVGTHEVDAAEQRLRALGVPTRFNRKTGDAILTDRRHRNAVLKALGFIDRSGGYGDYTGR